MWSDSVTGSLLTPTPVTGGWSEIGVYTASFALNTTASVVHDRWFSGSTFYHTGTIKVNTHDSQETIFESRKYVTSLTNLKNVYSTNESDKIRMYTRLKNWNPTIYRVSQTKVENNVIDQAFYKVFRNVDDFVVIDYGTGSLNHTKLSYDVSGNYFDINMSLFEPGFEYTVKIAFNNEGSYEEQRENFKFRVENEF